MLAQHVGVLGLHPSITQTRHLAHTSSHSRQVEAGESAAQSHPQLQNGFEARAGHVKTKLNAVSNVAPRTNTISNDTAQCLLYQSDSSSLGLSRTLRAALTSLNLYPKSQFKAFLCSLTLQSLQWPVPSIRTHSCIISGK